MTRPLHPHPPKVFLRFFRWYCNPRLADHIEGDLLEVYRKRIIQKGKRRADLKFIVDVLLLCRPDIVKTARGYTNTNSNAMFKSYFIIGWRNLVRNKAYSAINIGGLALGIAAAMLIGLWIYDELSFDRDQKHYDQISQVIQNVTNNGETQTWENVPFPLADELRKNYGSDFKHIAMAVEWRDHLLTFEDKKMDARGIFFEKEATEMFSLTMVQGTADLTDPVSILVSNATAKAYFGNDDPINKLLKIDNLPLVKVTGVYEDLPHNSTFAGLKFIATWDLYFNNSGWVNTTEDIWRPNFTSLFVQLNDNVDVATVSARIKDAKLKRVNAQLAKKKPVLFLHPMHDWHLYSEFDNGVNTGGAIRYVWMFGTIAGFVLLLACINFMNLSTARSERRAKEVGVRKAIGSRAGQLTQQFFSESFLTVLLAFALSLLMAQLALPLFNTIAQKQISISWGSATFWLTCFTIVIVTALIAGSYPAFYLSSFKPVKVLKGTFKAGRYAAVPRKILVVMQFTVSVTLIIGTMIVYKQIQFSKDRPVGYSRHNLVNIYSLNASLHEHFNAVVDELIQAGVIVTMAESQSPTTGIWSSTSGLSWSGKDPDLSTDVGAVGTSLDYGKTIGWKIKDGRDFSRDFPTDSSAVILNEAAVHLMGLKNPVGEVVTWWDESCHVIGVVEDMVIESPYDESRPIIYWLTNEKASIVLAKLNPAVSAHDALQKIEQVFKKFNTDQPFAYQFVDDAYAEKFGNEERVGKLAGIFTAFAVLISCLGIFGLASFTAEQRSKEFGIRKVLGASVLRLWRMLAQEFVLLAMISFIIAIPLSYYFLQQWLSKYAYRTEITWQVFAITGIGAITLTVLTISYQAITAAMRNPVKNLRSE